MRYPPDFLNLMIEQDAFRVCRLMRESEFITYCSERKVSITANRLHQLEKIGVFRPMLRVYKPDVTIKIETNDRGSFNLGVLGDGEKWNGETQVEMARFDPTTSMTDNWRQYGMVWVPGQGHWAHAATIDDEPNRHEAYYSRFQIYPLAHRIIDLTINTQLEWAVEPDGSLRPEWAAESRAKIADHVVQRVKSLQGIQNDEIKAAFAQIIANRFFFSTQSDGRHITMTSDHDRNWNWYDYARAWQTQPVIDAFELTEDASKASYERLDIEWSRLDPLADWYKLARFVKVEKRKRLKGAALHAVTLREIAHMSRLFHKQAFGQELQSLGEVGVRVLRRIPDVDPEADPLRALELIANDFGVNPKSQLVLFVEGETEKAVLPVIFERYWNTPASYYGIEILSLGGVDNGAGGKENPFSALWRLIDYLHHHQTLAFVLLDNEGLAARNVKKGLPKANSVHSNNRRATRRDHIKIWKTNFEFENFSDTELAKGINILAGRSVVGQSDVAGCRASVRCGITKGQKLRTIDRLYQEKTGCNLNKPQLGLILTDIIFDPNTRRKLENRPIIRFLDRIANKAALNHQPITQELWEHNQTSGHLGTLLPSGRARRRALGAQRNPKRKSS